MLATDLDVLTEGIRAAAALVAIPVDDARRADAEDLWRRFETDLRARGEDVPLAQMVRRCGLDTFELRCVLLALATHLRPRDGGDPWGRPDGPLPEGGPVVGLALHAFCGTPEERVAARAAFLQDGRLLRHHILARRAEDDDSAQALLLERLRLSVPTLRFLLREDELSASVAKVARLERPTLSLQHVILPPGQVAKAARMVEHHPCFRRIISEWGFDQVLPYGRGLTMLFSGPSGTGKTLLAHALASHGGRPLLSLSAADLPGGEGLDQVLTDVFNEAALRDAIVLVEECETLLGNGDRRKATVFQAIETFDGILILTTNRPQDLDPALERRIVFHLPFEEPTPEQRLQMWETHIPPEAPIVGEVDLEALANRYDFTGGTIRNAVLSAVNAALARSSVEPRLTMELLEEGCQSQLRHALEDLTVRTTTHLRLPDLVLGEIPMRRIRELLGACRHHSLVLNAWGFGERLATGKGIIALFDGPPGTGKTYAAEILSGELDRPLYRVNIPEIVSKWLGETEKHIRAVFQQARLAHAMLLFDEADSLFSSRVTETRTAQDRSANMEVNLLLQEIERFPGICILTTNSFGALDKALVRRIQFRVTFEEPAHEERARIWRVLCPARAPIATDVEFGKLAKAFEMTGAMIKNSLLRAAYWAADGDRTITHAILERACRDEYIAAGRVARDPTAVAPPPPLAPVPPAPAKASDGGAKGRPPGAGGSSRAFRPGAGGS